MGEWTERLLADVSSVMMGQSPPGFLVTKLEHGLPFLQGNAEFGKRYPHPRLQCDGSPKRCGAGDVLISVRAPVGAINEADQVYGMGRGLAAVRFTGVDRRFGLHALKQVSPALHRVSQGTTFAAIGQAELAELRIDCPRRAEEQEGIAEILDAVEEAVEASERLVVKEVRSRRASWRT